MVIKLMDIVVKPLIIHFSGSFLAKIAISLKEMNVVELMNPLNQKIALVSKILNSESSKSRTSILNRTV